MNDPFAPGQRWTSEPEPELGLGSVLRVSARTVTIVFQACAETREYALDHAPLRRVHFRAGDTIRDRAGHSMVVESVNERGGLFYYQGDNREWCETGLNDTISFGGPDERLQAGEGDDPEVFDLRVTALRHQHRRRQSSVRGFVGGRIELIPHQLYIAAEVTGRLWPRVLLADEVGLGKTIEACLILHRLLLTGRAQRILILVPESLVHQWFVELLRRFNLWFHIFDEERCEAIAATDPEANPFLDEQLVLAGLNLLIDEPTRLAQAKAAGWDVLVIDEAHHLDWSPASAGPSYQAVETLGRAIPGLLLLTATPGQLGVASHFARLRLLDPDRFVELDEFLHEAEGYIAVARAAECLLGDNLGADEAGRTPTKALRPEKQCCRHAKAKIVDDPRERTSRDEECPCDVCTLARILGRPAEAIERVLDQDGATGGRDRKELLDALLDRHGTGRVMFRNTRATIKGFPPRQARLAPLPIPSNDYCLAERIAAEYAADVGANADPSFTPEFSGDPRIDWLADLLRRLEIEKVLLICRTRAKVEAIEAALRQRLTVKMAVFHEGLPLVRRDRNAAWFAEEDGARLLLCSEIGSEGRNFQFAHHLVLFDLPLDPELIEQRLGRLDRIGQRSTIQVHVPFIVGTSSEVLARWYHEGLNAFEKNVPAGRELRETLGPRVHDLAQDFHETAETAHSDLEQLLAETRAVRERLAAELEQGRDRLLELNSFRPERAVDLVKSIRFQDADQALDAFMLAVFDHYHIHVEELGRRTYLLGSAGVFADTFPGLPAEGLVVTCDRSRALEREDVQFLTWDHPLVTGAMDMLLGSGAGNCSVARWPETRAAGLFVEAIYVLECIAPPALHVDRFLPPTPLRIVVDHRGVAAAQNVTAALGAARLVRADPFLLLDHPELRDELLPTLLEKAVALASHQIAGIVEPARQRMQTQLREEIERLEDLQRINRHVRPEEIAERTAQRDALASYLDQARLRLDAVRWIQCGAEAM